MLELQDNAAFKDHLRDFLVQTKSFSSQDNADLFADEAAAAREVSPAFYSVNLLHQLVALLAHVLSAVGSIVSHLWVQVLLLSHLALSVGCIMAS